MPLKAIPGIRLSRPAMDVLEAAEANNRLTLAGSIEELVEAAAPRTLLDDDGYYTVGYDVPGRGFVSEARACRVRNGISANYVEPYMRRRDPDCMVISDATATDKPTFDKRFGKPFDPVRQETFDWLKTQPIACFFFEAGLPDKPMNALAICPLNAAFFALGLAMLQGIVPIDHIREDGDNYTHQAVLYVAPPFRHTHFDGKQIVVHNRRFTDDKNLHELFSYNLYPGPSAKKGVYGMLLTLGERASTPWTTAHCSTVQVVTPYDNVTTIMHEGASGGGKSELLEQMHRQPDGRLLMGRNVINNDQWHVTIPRGCELRPVTDDMALCHPALQHTDDRFRRLTLIDAEQAWFIRVNHIARYGTDPHLESLTIHPPGPVLFLNIDANPGSTALIWEHIQDKPGEFCPNPRVILPRDYMPGVVHEPVTVSIRSFGVRPAVPRRDWSCSNTSRCSTIVSVCTRRWGTRVPRPANLSTRLPDQSNPRARPDGRSSRERGSWHSARPLQCMRTVSDLSFALSIVAGCDAGICLEHTMQTVLTGETGAYSDLRSRQIAVAEQIARNHYVGAANLGGDGCLPGTDEAPFEHAS